MKTRIAVLTLAAAVIAALATPSMAVFTPLVEVQVEAEAVVGGTPQVIFALEIRDAADPLGSPVRTKVDWSGVVAGGTSWKIADQVLVIDSNITDEDGGIQIMTDNTDATQHTHFVPPTAVSSAPSSNPAGLLKANAVAGGSTDRTLSLAWSAQGSTQVVGTEISAVDPNNNGRCGAPVDPAAFVWKFMNDRETKATDFTGDGDTLDQNPFPGCTTLDTPDFINGNAYSKVMDVDGYHWGQAPGEWAPHPDNDDVYVYLQANFTTALPSKTYKTERIIVESYTE